MKTIRFAFPYSLAVGFAAAQIPSTLAPQSTHDEALALEAMVVSAGAHARSAFDLAQGTTVLVSDDLRRTARATLGETLANSPGVNATYYGPGASRPIIRGLGGDRVRMLDNGVGSLDASNVSPDHNVAVEPLLVERIEVIRGPATLLYGSSAVGGVVNVIDNRIPPAGPDFRNNGRVEVRYDSAANERTGIATSTTYGKRLAAQATVLSTRSDDVQIPGFGDQANPGSWGTLTNSAVATRSLSAGIAGYWASGHAGVAASEYATRYGVPGGEPIAIDMRQRRIDLKGEAVPQSGPFKSVKVRFGLADYRHAELDVVTGDEHTRFSNRAHEGRLELIQRDRANLSGMIGLQMARSDLIAAGEETTTPPTLTRNHAVFALESYELRPDVSVQFGGRYEFQTIELGAISPSVPAYPGYMAGTGERRRDHGLSVAAGAVYKTPRNYSLGLSLAYTQRIPVAQEIYSNGPHGGTGAYEIGRADLGLEKSLGLDVTLRKRAGFVSGSVGIFVNRMSDFVFQQLAPDVYFMEESRTFEFSPSAPSTDALPVYQFVARAAVFRGAEAEIELHLLDRQERQIHLGFAADYVHAQQTTDDQPLPRMPPLRLSAMLRYRGGPWAAGIGFRHAFRQDRVAPHETETDHYTLAGADVSYRIIQTRVEWEIFARGSNLTDADARVSTSFLKQVAPLPGRSLTLGVRLLY